MAGFYLSSCITRFLGTLLPGHSPYTVPCMSCGIVSFFTPSLKLYFSPLRKNHHWNRFSESFRGNLFWSSYCWILSGGNTISIAFSYFRDCTHGVDWIIEA